MRSFAHSVLVPLGLDRHPELWTDYFGHYRRLVWLTQSEPRNAGLAAQAEAVRARFGLPMTVVETGTGRLERELEKLIGVDRPAMRSGGLRRLLPLLHQARYEVLPTASAEQAVLEFVPREVTVTVTASPTKGLEPTLALTERLIGHGYRVVPHLSARQVRGGGHLAEIVPRLVTAGVDDVFVPAGDADPPSRGVHQRARSA